MSTTTGLFTNFKDDDLTFFALTYKNYEATAECLMDCGTLSSTRYLAF
jgi:hypothetical protein